MCEYKNKPVLDGVNAQGITEQFGLSKLIASGSTADLYEGGSDYLRRLSIDAGSHNMLVSGSNSEFSFPGVIHDYGIVGVSDEEPDDRYWLLDVERCYHFSDNFDEYASLLSALSAINENLQENDPADCDLARRHILKHIEVLENYSLLKTLDFIVEFADKYQLNLDFSPSNFMLNKSGDVVAVDPVFGPDPDVFA